jgi:hypothetical protein
MNEYPLIHRYGCRKTIRISFHAISDEILVSILGAKEKEVSRFFSPSRPKTDITTVKSERFAKLVESLILDSWHGIADLDKRGKLGIRRQGSPVDTTL